MPLAEATPDRNGFLEHARRIFELTFRLRGITEVVLELGDPMLILRGNRQRQALLENRPRRRGSPFEKVQKAEMAKQARQPCAIVHCAQDRVALFQQLARLRVLAFNERLPSEAVQDSGERALIAELSRQ